VAVRSQIAKAPDAKIKGEDFDMRKRMIAAAAALALASGGYAAPAHAIGCVSGGLAGAVAGHMVHHGVLGALGGCIAGHHINKQHKENRQQNAAPEYGQQPAPGYGQRSNDQGQGTIYH
jgi:hypothetical protein